MGLFVLFKCTPTRIDALELDAMLSETHSSSASVTEQPVEETGDARFHVVVSPVEVDVDGIVTDTPLSRSLVPFTVGIPGRAANAFETLQQLADSGAPVTVVTTLRTYEDMVLTSLTVQRDASAGDALQFKAHFKQLRSAQGKDLSVPGGKLAAGRKPAEIAPPGVAAKVSGGLF